MTILSLFHGSSIPSRICHIINKADISELVFIVWMLMNAGRIVVIMIVTLMPIVSIMMDHMTANVKMVFMVMVISIVFLTNCAK